MEKAYVRLDKIGADARIESVAAKEVLKNGQFVDLGKSIDGEEMVEATKTKEGKAPEAFVASAFVDYGHPDFDITKQEVKPGKPARAYHKVAGQVISVNKELAPGIKVNDPVTVGKDGLGFKKATESDEVVGIAIREDYLAFIGDLMTIRFK